jgi:hypothetical protein
MMVMHESGADEHVAVHGIVSLACAALFERNLLYGGNGRQ